MPFQNFSIWRGRLPHWRADDVRYFVSFRHRRDLDDRERDLLFRALVRPDGRQWDLLVLCVLPAATELIFTVREAPSGRPYELSTVVEKAKQKVGRLIVKRTGERYPPFYAESFDRIVRDEAELEERWTAIVESPMKAELTESAQVFPTLWIKGE